MKKTIEPIGSPLFMVKSITPETSFSKEKWFEHEQLISNILISGCQKLKKVKIK